MERGLRADLEQRRDLSVGLPLCQKGRPELWDLGLGSFIAMRDGLGLGVFLGDRFTPAKFIVNAETA